MPFQLHPQLEADTHLICRTENCQILLMDDARFPWIVLVPEVADIRELYELKERQQQQAYQSILRISKSLAEYSNADKMNVAALGNQVPQLHIHIIARYETDAAWPGPVWGVGQAEPYRPDQLQQRLSDLGATLS
jgi:diadenosine tetraphosphate (Ap4A) HIT family hydrolase